MFWGKVGNPLRRNAGRNRKRRKIVNADGGKKKRNGSVAKRGVASAKKRNVFVKKRSWVASTSLHACWNQLAMGGQQVSLQLFTEIRTLAKVWFLKV